MSVPALSAADWDALFALPVGVIAASVNAETRDDLDQMREISAGLRKLMEVAYLYRDNPVVDRTFDHYREGGAGEAAALAQATGWTPAQTDDLLQRCAVATDDILSRVPVDWSNGFRDWLLATAFAIVSAAGTGGFLGIGSTRVTEPESAYMTALRQALRMPREDEIEG